MKLLSRVRFFATSLTVVYQAPPSMEFSKQEYWSRLPFPSPGDFSDPGIKAVSPALQADALSSEPSGKPGGMQCMGSQRVRHNLATEQQQIRMRKTNIVYDSSELWCWR